MIIRPVTGAVLIALLAGCGSSAGAGAYKSMTCGQWIKLANSKDFLSTGLSVANDYLDSTNIDPGLV